MVVLPPIGLLLARAESRVPGPDPKWAYEPKFDGWRAALFCARGMLQSRRNNDLAARFPEVIAAACGMGELVLDGEVVALREGRLDFGALTSTPGRRADAGVTIYYIAFDLLADGEKDLRGLDYAFRRQRLEKVFVGARPPLQLAPSTRDRAEALVWMQPEQAVVGVEGVVAKDVSKPYRPGRTGDWVKVRQMAVVDAVVVGVTGRPERPEELVLARPDADGALRGIGLSLPLSPGLREQAGRHVVPTGEPAVRVSSGVFGGGHTEYLPMRPELVVEVQAERSVETFTSRLRPRVHRLRLDLDVSDVG